MTTTPEAAAGPGRKPAGTEPHRIGGGLLDPKMLWKATPDAFRKLDPRVQLRNPVLFVVEVGAALTTYTAITKPSIFNWTIVVWLWLTVLFANLAEAVAEGRGKAQAETLRRTKRETVARRLLSWRPHQGQNELREEPVPGTQLTLGDHVVVEAGEIIPGDGDVVEGVASVDESAITGESAPVIRESGGDRSAVTGGTRVLSDRNVTKPFAMDELLARIRAVGRRAAPDGEVPQVRLGELVIDLAAKRVTRASGSGAGGSGAGGSGAGGPLVPGPGAAGPGPAGGADVRLTPTEWHLLEVLLRHPGKLLSQRQLLADVWGPGYGDAAGNLRLYMAQLRRKLEPDPARPRWLITEPGMGYRYQPGPEEETATKDI